MAGVSSSSCSTSTTFSLAILVRNVRPWMINLIYLCWISYRCMRLITTTSANACTNNTTTTTTTTNGIDNDYIQNYFLSSFSSSSSPPSSSCWQNDPTLLQIMMQILINAHQHIQNLISGVKATTTLDTINITATTTNDYNMIMTILIPILTTFLKILSTIITFGLQLVQDLMAIFAVMAIIRLMYVGYHHFPSWKQIKNHIQDSIFIWAKENVSFVQRILEKETNKMIPDMKKSLMGKTNHDDVKLLQIPDHGRDGTILFENLQQISTIEHQNSWKTGKLSGTVYTSDEGHIELMNKVYALYSIANTLHPGIWPRLNQCEAELISMTSDLLHGTNIGCTTSGGTESIMLAIKAHLQYYGHRRHITHPELICGSTAHAAVDKACEVFGIRKVVIDCNDGKYYTLNPKLVRRRITSNTIMIYGSAPCFPQGTIDPIEELGDVAQRYDIGFHVDACLGGFVLPFANTFTTNGSKVEVGSSNGVGSSPSTATSLFPKFDFRVPGVTSMSADTHKFGYAPKGTSIVLYRHNQLRHAQYFCYSQWTGGIYATPTFAGSRPSALVACAWASLVSTGKVGYQQRTNQILTASRRICVGINDDIPELQVLGTQRPSMVVCFGPANNKIHNDGTTTGSGVDVYRVADAMKVKGWSLNSLQHPPSVHVCVTVALAPKAKEFLVDLKECVAEVKRKDDLDDDSIKNNQSSAGRKNCSLSSSSKNTKQGTAGMYGMAGSLPEGPVADFLSVFLDLMLTAEAK